MAIREFELRNDPNYAFSISIDGTVYKIEFKINLGYEYLLSIYNTETDNYIVINCAVRHGVDFLKYVSLDAQLIYINNNGVDPNRDELADGKLMLVTEDE